MSEDVSATMRVGITVILVAALVATVLNLMVMSNSLLSGGQSTLQSGIDSVSQQEFAGFNNVRVTGTQVQTALNLFQGRDIAILVQTKALKNLDGTTILECKMLASFTIRCNSDIILVIHSDCLLVRFVTQLNPTREITMDFFF